LQSYRHLGRYVPALAALVLPLAFLVYLLQIYLHGDAGAKVFASYWASGRQLAAGGDPFAFVPGVWVFTDKAGRVIRDVNLNSPIFLPFCQLFALLPLKTAAIAWGAVFCAGFLALIAWVNRVTQPHWAKAAWAFLFLPVWDSVIIGQNYLLLLAAAVAAWAGLRSGRTMLTAIALGLLIAFKPNFAVLAPVLFVAGHRRLAVAITLAAIAFFLLPALLYGPQLYQHWFAALREDNHWVFTTTVSIPAYFRRLDAAAVGQVLAGISLVGALAIAWRKRPDVELATMLGLIVSILVSPLAWFHYLLVLLPFLVARTWSRATTLAAIALVVLQPTIVLYAMGKSSLLMATLGGAMLFATMLLAAGIVQEIWRSSAEQPRKSALA
jgi:hypothetical protein